MSKRFNSIRGKLDVDTASIISELSTVNSISNEVLAVDLELNKGVDRNFKTVSEVVNNETPNIKRNSSGFLLLNNKNVDYKITAGLITKKYNIEDISVNKDVNISER